MRLRTLHFCKSFIVAGIAGSLAFIPETGASAASHPLAATLNVASGIALPAVATGDRAGAAASGETIELAQNHNLAIKRRRAGRGRGVRRAARAGRHRGARRAARRGRAPVVRGNRGGRRVARRSYRRGYNRGYRRGYRRAPRYYRPYRRYNPYAAGAVGFAAGALIAGAASANNVVVVERGIPAPYTAEWYRQCSIKYRSFRASDGTFLTYSGVRRTCRLP